MGDPVASAVAEPSEHGGPADAVGVAGPHGGPLVHQRHPAVGDRVPATEGILIDLVAGASELVEHGLHDDHGVE
eukprot:10074257-Alexandrium_andersonii.AAC.1